MLGAIAGDIIGSRFEGSPTKSTDFALFTPESRFTDDTVLTIATAEALMTDGNFAAAYRRWYARHPDVGFARMFRAWARDPSRRAYGSFGNGSAMRVSPVGWWYDDIEAVLAGAKASAAVTHSHPEGIKGAQAVATAVFLAFPGSGKPFIRSLIEARFGYDLSRPLAAIRPGYSFDVTCAGSVPEALVCFLEAGSWEEAVRNAVSLGGDSDTQAAMAGAVAEAYYGGVPAPIAREALARLTPAMREVVWKFGDALAARSGG